MTQKTQSLQSRLACFGLDNVEDVVAEFLQSVAMEGILGHMTTNSIERVKIHHGEERPIKIEVHMRSEVGFFQDSD